MADIRTCFVPGCDLNTAATIPACPQHWTRVYYFTRQRWADSTERDQAALKYQMLREITEQAVA